MDYLRIVDELNSSITEEFGEEPEEKGYNYDYFSDGKTHSVWFSGIEIFNSEAGHDENPELDDIEDMKASDFKKHLKEKVAEIGISFMQLSLNVKASSDGKNTTQK